MAYRQLSAEGGEGVKASGFPVSTKCLAAIPSCYLCS